MTRELEHPVVEIEDDGDDGLRLRFYAPGSKFGAVEIVLSMDEVYAFQQSLDEAAAFAGATAGDSDG